MDALAVWADKGRCRQRKSSGRWQATRDPTVSEWENPPRLWRGTPAVGGGGNLENWNILVPKGKEKIPLVAASESGKAQTLRFDFASQNLTQSYSPEEL